jgi:hypothetical protein
MTSARVKNVAITALLANEVALNLVETIGRTCSYGIANKRMFTLEA